MLLFSNWILLAFAGKSSELNPIKRERKIVNCLDNENDFRLLISIRYELQKFYFFIELLENKWGQSTTRKILHVPINIEVQSVVGFWKLFKWNVTEQNQATTHIWFAYYVKRNKGSNKIIIIIAILSFYLVLYKFHSRLNYEFFVFSLKILVFGKHK